MSMSETFYALTIRKGCDAKWPKGARSKLIDLLMSGLTVTLRDMWKGSAVIHTFPNGVVMIAGKYYVAFASDISNSWCELVNLATNDPVYFSTALGKIKELIEKEYSAQLKISSLNGYQGILNLELEVNIYAEPD